MVPVSTPNQFTMLFHRLQFGLFHRFLMLSGDDVYEPSVRMILFSRFAETHFLRRIEIVGIPVSSIAIVVLPTSLISNAKSLSWIFFRFKKVSSRIHLSDKGCRPKDKYVLTWNRSEIGEYVLPTPLLRVNQIWVELEWARISRSEQNYWVLPSFGNPGESTKDTGYWFSWHHTSYTYIYVIDLRSVRI